MRKEFQMTEEQLATLMESCKPTPAIMLQCGPPATTQEKANSAWWLLGREMGFDGMTVRPVSGKEPRFFTAEEKS